MHVCMNVQHEVVMVLLTLLKIWGLRTDIHTDSHVTTKIFEIDWLPNFLSYGAPLARLPEQELSLYGRGHGQSGVT